ncbi:MAG: DUF2283 domain-containing protein [Gemmatimonadota bacterium]
MRLHYDEEADALYLRLDESEIVESEEVRPGIVPDFDANRQAVGVEILNLESRVPGAELKKLQFEVA